MKKLTYFSALFLFMAHIGMSSSLYGMQSCSKKHSNPVTSLIALPFEIMGNIAKNLTDPKDTMSFLLTSKKTYQTLKHSTAEKNIAIPFTKNYMNEHADTPLNQTSYILFCKALLSHEVSPKEKIRIWNFVTKQPNSQKLLEQTKEYFKLPQGFSTPSGDAIIDSNDSLIIESFHRHPLGFESCIRNAHSLITNPKYKKIYHQLPDSIKKHSQQLTTIDNELLDAIEQKKLTPEYLAELLQKGASVNAIYFDKETIRDEKVVYKDYPLSKAIDANNTVAIDLLIAHGAHINKKNTNGNAPLTQAVLKNNSALATQLIEKGADVQTTDDEKCTPLHYVGYLNLAQLCSVLLDKKAQVNAIDRFGKTPLHCAAYANSTAVAKLLIQHGADKTIEDTVNSCTPYDLARNPDLKELLRLE